MKPNSLFKGKHTKKALFVFVPIILCIIVACILLASLNDRSPQTEKVADSGIPGILSDERGEEADMEKLYDRINFENAPSTKTPLNEENLNKMDSAINELDNRVIDVSNELINMKGWSPLTIEVNHNEGWYMSAGGNWTSHDSFTTSDPIPVYEGMKLRYKHTYGNAYISQLTFTTTDYVEGYGYRPTSAYHVQRVVTDDNADILVDVPVGAKYVFVCWQNNRDTLDTISLSVNVLDYINKINDNTETEEIDFNLPDKLYAVKGEELNIYFDNIVDGRIENYSVNVDCQIGQQFDRCFRVTPSEVGTHSITITVSNGKTATTKTSTIYVTDASTENEKNVKVIVIGDSTTNGGVPVRLLVQNATDKKISVSALGTKGNGDYKHEGRSGWSANLYVNEQTAGSDNNAFYNPSSKKFDFAYYLAQNNIENPDMVILNLGINDVFGKTNDVELDTEINNFVDYYDFMIASIKNAVSNVKIGVCLTIPPNASQDAFGKSYNCGQTRDRYKHNNFELVKRIISEYGNRESENIYLLPINTNLDTVYNMGTEEIAVNKRNTRTYESPIGYGAVHPAESGLWQIADVYWFAINKIFE